MPTPRDKEIRDRSRLLRRWRAWHQEQIDEALRGPHHAELGALLGFLNRMTLADGDRLIDLVKHQGWHGAGSDMRYLILRTIDLEIIKIREANGLDSIDDALEGEDLTFAHYCATRFPATPGILRPTAVNPPRAGTTTMTMPETAKTPAVIDPSTAVSRSELAAYAKYARSGGNYHGDLLKFSGKSGVYTAGAEGREIPLGTEMAAIIPEMLVGYIMWIDGAPERQALVPLDASYDRDAFRVSLGDIDRSQWARDDDGRPKDPWSESAYLPLTEIERGTPYTFSTSSVGGNGAIKRLVGAYQRMLEHSPRTTIGHLPITELGETHYRHSIKERGTIYNPVFTIVDWIPAKSVPGLGAPEISNERNKDIGDEPSEPELPAEPAKAPPKQAQASRTRL